MQSIIVAPSAASLLPPLCALIGCGELCTQVHLVDGCVTAAQAAALSAQLLCENPLMHHAAVTIQARVRRLLARKRCAKERGLKSTSELPGNNLRVDSTDDDYMYSTDDDYMH